MMTGRIIPKFMAHGDDLSMEVNHPDHTLITYPRLGHTFYPSKNWIQPLGPIGENVLVDLHSWLTSPARKVRYIAY